MDLQALLSKAAPWLAAASAGPAGLAAMAVSKVADVLGADPKGDVVQALLGATPEQLAALRQADRDFQAHMAELGYKTLTDLEQIAAGDRASARATAAQGGTLPWVTGFAMTLVLVAIGCEMTVLLNGYPKEVADVMAGRILGFIDSLGATGAAFLMGTTINSSRKTELLAQAEPIK